MSARKIEWLQLALGVWVLASPWLLGLDGDSVMMWSNTAAGLTIVIANLWALFGDLGKNS